MRCDSVDWMLLVHDGPENVYELGVTSRQTGKLLQWLRDCQVLKDSAPCSHSCRTMRNRNHSKSIIKVDTMTKPYYWRICKEVRKCPQGVTFPALSHSQLFFFLWPVWHSVHCRCRHNISCGGTVTVPTIILLTGRLSYYRCHHRVFVLSHSCPSSRTASLGGSK
jgi:hypothetical protein